MWSGFGPMLARCSSAADIRAAMDVLARIDRVEAPWESSLTSALYYARVAFACLGCHLDERKPLLGPWDQSGERDSGLADAVSSRTKSVRSAWDLLLKWDRDAEHIREMRLRVHGAADIGLMNRDLRQMIETDAKQLAITPPSLNRVRRTLSIWTLGELDRSIGTVMWPVPDLEGLLERIQAEVALIRPQARARVREIVEEVASQTPA